MTKNYEEKRSLVPRLRFSEFKDDWAYTSLGCFLEGYSERAPANTDLPIYSSTREGLKAQKDYFDGRELLNDGEYGVVPAGYFVYRHMSDDNIFAFNINSTGQNIAVSKEYPVFKTENMDDYFLYYMLNYGSDFKQFAATQKKGGTRTRLYFTTLCSWKTLLPTLSEQQKIADCLSSLNERITAETHKLDALKAHKKELLQELFPTKGEAVPRLRFPEFQDAGEWEEKKMDSCIQLISGVHLAPDEYGTIGDIPYFTGPSDFTNNNFESSKWVQKSSNTAIGGDILVTVKGSGVGELWYLTLPCVAMGRQLMAVRAENGCCGRFLYQFLVTKGSRFKALAAGNLIPGLSRKDILAIISRFPSSNEQQKIADCLSSLDELIAAQTQKIDLLKAHKKGLMQQLFPAPDEARA